MNLGTHAFVGSLPCGCFVHFASDLPDSPDGNGAHVLAMLRAGYVVRWLPRDEAHEFSLKQCYGYPHEQWQKEYEARLRAFVAAAPSSQEPK